MWFDTGAWARATNPRAAFLDATRESVAKIKLLRNRVLVATFIESEVSKGGIIKPPKTLDESRFQGKVGLVLKLGPMAFEFDDPEHLRSEKPRVGDWIFYRASDATECGVKINSERWPNHGTGVLCRHIHDDLVVGIVDDPESIW